MPNPSFVRILNYRITGDRSKLTAEDEKAMRDEQLRINRGSPLPSYYLNREETLCNGSW